jgi:hypothetical protein
MVLVSLCEKKSSHGGTETPRIKQKRINLVSLCLSVRKKLNLVTLQLCVSTQLITQRHGEHQAIS